MASARHASCSGVSLLRVLPTTAAGVTVGEGVGLGANVAVGEGVGLGANVAVGEEVGLGANVAVGEEVGLGADVAVGEEVGLGADVAVGEGLGFDSPPHATKTTSNRAAIGTIKRMIKRAPPYLSASSLPALGAARCKATRV